MDPNANKVNAAAIIRVWWAPHIHGPRCHYTFCTYDNEAPVDSILSQSSFPNIDNILIYVFPPAVAAQCAISFLNLDSTLSYASPKQ